MPKSIRSEPDAVSHGPRSPGRPSGWITLGRSILGWDRVGARGARARLRQVIRRYLEWNRGLLLDPWLRYLPAVKMLRDGLAGQPARLLDVGSGAAGLAYFLRQPVVGVDIFFQRAELARFASPLVPVRATATRLPFRDASFDAAVSMDTVEHLPPSERLRAIHELFRVARKLVIVGFPYGETSAAFDCEALLVEQHKGVALGWREEHVRHGVPGKELHAAILEAAKDLHPDVRLAWFGHESLQGLRLRWKLQFLVNKDSRAYGAMFAPLYWLHARGHRKRPYRRIYVARLTHTTTAV